MTRNPIQRNLGSPHEAFMTINCQYNSPKSLRNWAAFVGNPIQRIDEQLR